jgi:hypothetical protein
MPTAGSQPTPPFIPSFEVDDDSSGKIATFQPDGSTFTPMNAFFHNLGTNDRTCFTCHQPQNSWTVSSASVSARFEASGGTDPIFRLVDGATCPSDKVKTLADKRKAYKLLIAKGLIRIGLPIPMPMPPALPLQFEVTKVDDPYHCTTLTSPTAGMLSMYRRSLPSTNLGFLSAIMFDGREPSLQSQAMDATLTHAQGNPPGPTMDQVNQIVAFETGIASKTGIFTAQVFDNEAHSLHARNATGGPRALFAELSKFFIGINDPINPRAGSSTPISSTSTSLGKASGARTRTTKRKPACRSHAARKCSTPQTSTSQGSRALTTILTCRALPDFAVPVTTPPTSAIIRSKRL